MGGFFANIGGVRLRITLYVDVISSWCYWGEPAWAALRERLGERADFNWKIALMDTTGLPVSRAQEEWFYRRSGLLMKSPFMLRTDWYEPVLPEYLAPNLAAEAARDMGVTDDTARLAISHAMLRDGAPRIRELEVATEIAARASGIDHAKLLERARSAEIEQRIRDSTAEWHALGVTQRPTIVFDSDIGDRAVFSGFAQLAPLLATAEAMLNDIVFYESYKAHFGDPPPA